MNTDQLANFSGNWNNADNTGVFQLNVNHSTSNTNANYGTHLMYDFSVLVIDLTPWWKNKKSDKLFDLKNINRC